LKELRSNISQFLMTINIHRCKRPKGIDNDIKRATKHRRGRRGSKERPSHVAFGVVIMMGFLIYELFLLQLPKIEKRELPEKAKYCLEELKAYSTIKTLEMGGHIRPTGEFIEEMRECYRRKGWEVKR